MLHDYVLLKSVRAVCPRCFADDPNFDPEWPTDVLDGHLVERDGAVYLRRWCRRGHGEVWSLYEEDADLWRYLQQWRVPTRDKPRQNEIYPLPLATSTAWVRHTSSTRASFCSTSPRSAI